MTKPLILVTGATGKTGTPVLRQLLERGYPVRAMVHQQDARSQALSTLGAEVVVGDFLDLPSLHRAMTGAKRVYFCYPPFDGLLQATTNIAIAARAARIETLVNMSQLPAREQAQSPLSFEHWQAEQVLDWADIGAVHINPTFFAEDLYLFSGHSIARDGKLLLPFGHGKHAPVAAADIARVIVSILTDPKPHQGQRYVITGPDNMTMTEAAAILTTELGKPIEYVNLPIEPWRQALMQQATFPPYLATHLAAVAQDHQNGIFSAQTDAVERISGQPPQSLAQFVRSHRAAFSAPSALSPTA